MSPLFLAACTPEPAPAPPPPATVETPAPPAPPRPATDGLRPVDLSFGGAPGWAAGPCDRVADPSCVGEFTHTTGQVARVSAVPVRAPAAIPAFFDKLKADVSAQEGIADAFSIDGWSGIRFLQPAGTAGGSALVGISYALVAPDQRTIHVVTSVVDVAAQEPSDAALRALLGAATWTVP